MSTAVHTTSPESHDAHDPHLAHHFDTPEQQFATEKLGMWIFLATEILMFGGLFCGYAVYRHNHPAVFSFAHEYLNKWLGGINTIVLITSSLTMAWGVRAAQLGKTRLLAVLLGFTLLGGFGFMGIKAIEYRDKWQHHLGLGQGNIYRGAGGAAPAPATLHTNAGAAHGDPEAGTPATMPSAILPFDPNVGTTDAASIRPMTQGPAGLAATLGDQHQHLLPHDQEMQGKFTRLSRVDRERVYTFFGTYFVMTGLHGIHVLVGMVLIFWILMRSVAPATRKWLGPVAILAIGLFFLYLAALVGDPATKWIGIVAAALGALGILTAPGRARAVPAGAGEFGPRYFLPVDLVGLYWHLVDLIWIFLFPLLYLIH